MEFKNNHVINNFISNDEVILLLNWINSIEHEHNCDNLHIKEIRKSLNGNSYMFDISKNEYTEKITKFQSGNDVINQELPTLIHDIIERISNIINLPNMNVFLQVLDMNKGGKINPHYDTALDGFITYKCNISVLSEEYSLNIDKEKINLKELDLYCFEASLYKHWTENEFNTRRVLLSFGFILPYDALGRTEDDYRVRLSKRIEKHFQ